MLQLHGGQIDRHAQRPAGLLSPLLGPQAGATQYPFAHAHNQSGLFRQGNELIGWDQLAAMLPSKQRFDAGDGTVGAIKLGLEEQTKLVLIDRLVEVIFQKQGCLGDGLHLFAVGLDPVASGIFGAIHGQIRMTHQRDGIATMLRIQRQPDTGGDTQLVRANAQRFGEQRQHFFSDTFTIAHVGNTG